MTATEPSDLEISDHGAFDRKAKEQELAALNTQINDLQDQLEEANSDKEVFLSEIEKRKK